MGSSQARKPDQRKTLRRFERRSDARFLTFSCYRNLPLFRNPAICDAFTDRLTVARSGGPFELYAWVVMPNHVHLLLRPDLPEVTVSSVLRSVKRPFAEQVIRRWRQLEAPILERLRNSRGGVHFWQPGGGYDRNITSDEELLEKVEYIHKNPVRAGLTKRAADYPYSSAAWYSDKRSGVLPIDPLPL